MKNTIQTNVSMSRSPPVKTDEIKSDILKTNKRKEQCYE